MPHREPEFDRLLAICRKEKADGPVLFEFYMNDSIYQQFTKEESLVATAAQRCGDKTAARVRMMLAFKNLGYDYATVLTPEPLYFTREVNHENKRTYSLNDGAHIDSWEKFEQFRWPDYSAIDYSFIEELTPYIPAGMKLVPCGPGGLEEIVIALTGYENLCFLMADEPDLVDALFDAVGSRLDHYYREISCFDRVGACLSNDDWGFNTQTLLSHDQMERWIYPWHTKISQAIHSTGKPALLHSCGNIYPVFDKVISLYEGKHSYEDSILPVEDAWDQWHDRIAILGGIDVNYMIMESTEAVYTRSREILERTAASGSFALGTGNSVPDYLPTERYLAMLQAAWDMWK